MSAMSAVLERARRLRESDQAAAPVKDEQQVIMCYPHPQEDEVQEQTLDPDGIPKPQDQAGASAARAFRRRHRF